ncbi:hypothetical protein J6590_074309 [Homalodisca vitripennis]|nr:hypothetical protein J6590_074309 [Homalodisca vitripennis]
MRSPEDGGDTQNTNPGAEQSSSQAGKQSSSQAVKQSSSQAVKQSSSQAVKESSRDYAEYAGVTIGRRERVTAVVTLTWTLIKQKFLRCGSTQVMNVLCIFK